MMGHRSFWPIMFSPQHINTIVEESRRHRTGEARRIFHGRGGLFADLDWLTVDDLGDTGLLTTYRPVDGRDMEPLVDALQNQSCWERVLLQQRTHQIQWYPLVGDHPDSTTITEDNLQYELDLKRGRNIGFFFDMRPGRQYVREHTRGKKVLNLFAYTCAFSVTAVAGGADQVVNVDMSSSVLGRGRRNHQLNHLDMQRVRFLPHNVLKSFGKLKKLGPFDLIIVDPPTHQAGSFVAAQDYPKVVRRLRECLAPQGQVLACLNAPDLGSDFLEELFAKHNFQKIMQLNTPEEFRERNPELGLKAILFR